MEGRHRAIVTALMLLVGTQGLQGGMQEDECYGWDRTKEFQDNEKLLETLKEYDVAEVLEELGGAPASVKDSSSWAVDAPELDVPNASDRPLPDTTDKTHWLYDYRMTDWETYVRLEHALLRFKDTSDQLVDVRGEVWWSPPDLCGKLRHAVYRRDDQGFHADVLREQCDITYDSRLKCCGPDSTLRDRCDSYSMFGLSGRLLAALIG